MFYLGLPAGAHAVYITAHDTENPAKGKLFEIPITVIRTEQLSSGLKPGVEHQVGFYQSTLNMIHRVLDFLILIHSI